MVQIFLIGLGAGVASALLFAAIASGSVLAIGLFYVAPLPIMLAAVAWNHLAGLIAATVAAVGLGLFLGRWFALAHLVSVSLPAYALGYLALLARPGAKPGAFEWYPLGRVVVWSALMAAGVTMLSIPIFGLDFETYHATLKAGFERILRLQSGSAAGGALQLPGVDDPQRLLDLLVLIIPPAAAAISMLTTLLNLWLAGRIARVSGKLQRPWPDLGALSFPPALTLVFFAAIAGSFLPGLAGVVASLLAATLCMAYAILGFAVIHGLTRAFGGRAVVLTAVWASVFIFRWPLLLVIVIGLADAVVDFRAYAARRGRPQLPTRPSNE